MKIKNLLKKGTTELKIDDTYYLFVEKLSYDDVLLIELCTYEYGDMVCNGVELIQHNLTQNNTVTQLKTYGYALMVAYEMENGLRGK